jgi:broad specificity phosphatase PhoE
MPTILLLARHGETDWNHEHRVQGHSDVPLNDTGRAQAAELGRRLDLSGVRSAYSSDLSRARETAEIVLAGRLPLVTLESLRERHFGTWEGLTNDEIFRRFPDTRDGRAWGDGETQDAMTARVIGTLLHLATVHAGERVLVVTHGGPVRSALRSSGVEPGPIGNCEITSFEVVGDRLTRLD